MPDARKSRGGKTAIAAGEAPQKTTLTLDSVAALFRERWEQECIRSLLLADENRRLRALVQEQATQINTLKQNTGEAVDGA